MQLGMPFLFGCFYAAEAASGNGFARRKIFDAGGKGQIMGSWINRILGIDLDC